MRQFGVLIDTVVKLRDPRVPDQRIARVNPAPVGRLDEGVKDLFEHACVAGDLDAAADLLALLEKWHARPCHGDEDRSPSRAVHVKRMQGELTRRHIAKGSRPSLGPF
jgi:hypothetical protein